MKKSATAKLILIATLLFSVITPSLTASAAENESNQDLGFLDYIYYIVKDRNEGNRGGIIAYAAGDSQDSLTEASTLFRKGPNGATISWTSSNPNVISEDGKITPSLTANSEVVTIHPLALSSINPGGYFSLWQFNVTVNNKLTRVKADKENLQLGFANGDSSASVANDLMLPTNGAYQTKISWTSSNPGIISANGKITQPGAGKGDAKVLLTATVQDALDSATPAAVKTFEVNVTAGSSALADMNELRIGFQGSDNSSMVTQDLILPTKGKYGSAISWTSNKPNEVSPQGKVTLIPVSSSKAAPPVDVLLYSEALNKDVVVQVSPDYTAALTATVNDGKSTYTKTFNVVLANTALYVDARDLAIGYQGSDNASSVTQNVTLPAKGNSGTLISWRSSRPDVISNNGIVTRPKEGDAKVTLEADLSDGDWHDIKTFTVTVIDNSLAAAEQLVAIGYQSGDSASSVTQNLILSANGPYGTSVRWQSDNEALIAADGKVTRPVSGDANVTLTAVISKNGRSVSKTFTVTVIDNSLNLDKEALQIGYAGMDNASRVTQNLSLPASGKYGSSISWTSSKPEAISSTGVVTQLYSGNISVKLTATIRKGDRTAMKEFVVTAVDRSVELDLESLSIGYKGSDSASGVTQNITLPASGAHGTTIQWTSDKPGFISNSGIVTRPPTPLTPDETVTLTAKISKGSSSATKSFTLTVLKDNAVILDKAALDVIFAEGNQTAVVTQDVTLKTSGAHGTKISWTSNSPEIISSTGKVTRPADMNRTVTLTATISKNGYSETKSLMVTVLFEVTGQAEDGGFSIGFNAWKGSGWKGSGYMNFDNAEGYIKWTFTVLQDGLYDLGITYANGGNTDRPMYVAIDNVAVNTALSFKPTGSWNTSWKTVVQPVQLTKGQHILRLQTKGFSGPNLDQFSIMQHKVW
ncbi:hypothetical protein M3223_15200 [Paenibacillus pasadenensis]|uniref:immunoglobulin-like domain-containing protein n=1 Tax=Paenibacillus pasadenensis TaxID=217090 RepID=UPI00203C35E2|nr:immunoglobulin-like domain-containing protein [Paenibacillus pasadenensis]MCM3748697.1 hypothetical protein [Paenibacillus pasadenensis]